MTHLKKLQTRLSEIGADAVIVSSEISQRYLSGFAYTDGYLLISPTKAIMLTDFRYTEAAKKEVNDFEIIEPQGTMFGELYRLMLAEGYENVAIEEKELTLADHENMCYQMPKVNLIKGASALIDNLRIVKDAEEIAIITEAQRMTDLAFEHILKFINRNVTEREIAIEIEFFMRKLGAESAAFDTIAVSGAVSSLPHGVPRDVKIENGFLTMDFGAKYKGYCADMTRTVVIGRADEEMKKLYNTVYTAQKAALDALKAGMLCREADAIARRIIDGAGYEGRFGHGLGHGVGMFIHEAPRLSARAGDAVLEVGNIVTVEPGIYIEGKYGCRIEDMVAITEDGILNFTKSPKELIEI
ncbi:MAG: aminopeptidase P family protein [Clostridia bacterium]|nr:aminopeptidase P family protein [Clostridia bacterium]